MELYQSFKGNEDMGMGKTLLAVVLVSCLQLCACGTPMEERESNGVSVPEELSSAASESSESQSESEPDPDEIEVEQEEVEQPEFPVVMSSHTFENGITGDGRAATLYLEMIDGIYDPELSFWNYTWDGNYQFRVKFEDGEEVLSELIPLAFGDSFEIGLSDYNDDGEPDFVIGQWGSLSAGDFYGMFTVRQSGLVEMLPVRGDLRANPSAFGVITIDEETDVSYFFIPYSHRVSPVLEKSEQGFVVEYRAARGFEALIDPTLEDAWWEEKPYGIPTNSFLRDYYEWCGDHFMLTHQEIIDPEE